MYESQTFSTILQRMLDRVPADVDKREGGIIYDALAPAAWELARMYKELDINLNLSFADTAAGEYLARRTSEFGIQREPASKATRKGLFYGSGNVLIDIPVGSRFSDGSMTYTVVQRLLLGTFELECESFGVAGNQYFGALLPIDYVTGLASAVLSDVLVPGEDEESDTSLRQRYFAALNEQPFGGNVSDYKKKVGEIPGVGGVKVYPAWQGGGTVKCTIIASDFNPPSPVLISDVQTEIDPVVNHGEGIGLAPIGHYVTISGVSNLTVNFETTLTLANGVTIGQVLGEIQSVIDAYLLSLRQSWMNEEQIVIRVSQIEARVLSVSGVTDITGTKLNGGTANLILGAEQIPQLGTVTLHA